MALRKKHGLTAAHALIIHAAMTSNCSPRVLLCDIDVVVWPRVSPAVSTETGGLPSFFDMEAFGDDAGLEGAGSLPAFFTLDDEAVAVQPEAPPAAATAGAAADDDGARQFFFDLAASPFLNFGRTNQLQWLAPVAAALSQQHP